MLRYVSQGNRDSDLYYLRFWYFQGQIIENLDYIIYIWRQFEWNTDCPLKTPIRLRGCAGWSESSVDAREIL